MASTIDVSRDLASLRTAAAEFFLEGYEWPDTKRKLDQTPPELKAEAMRSMMQPRTLPEGCYVWVAYLIWLEGILEVTTVALFAVEVEGLLLLKQERIRFQNAHPPCPQCGMPNERHTLRCRECMAEIGN